MKRLIEKCTEMRDILLFGEGAYESIYERMNVDQRIQQFISSERHQTSRCIEADDWLAIET